MRPSNSVDKIETSSEQRAAAHKEKRKRSGSTSCHQCHKSDRARVFQCNKCGKRYCILCMTRWYPTIEEASFVESCPVCRSICNCGACLQKVTVEELSHSDLKLSSEKIICYSKYIVRVLTPSLKKFVAEPNLEREEEAKIQGLTSGDNYCIPAADTGEADLKHFQWLLSTGEPVVVGNVLSGAFGLSWEPKVMERAFRVSGKNDHAVNVKNCITWGEEEINIQDFFEGYTRGLFDSRGSPKILMLADWPPSDSFDKTLPCHFAELIRCLPFKQYTHPVAGCLNIAAKLPQMSMSALGPKICVSYGPFGVDQEGHQYYSLNKLCCAVSDRVNILMHTTAITHTPQQLLTMEKLKKRHVTQDPLEILENNEVAGQLEKTKHKGEKGRENKGKSPLSSDRSQVSEVPEGGAIWDIFRRQDVPKLEEYFKNHSEEFGHVFPSIQMIHPVHEQIFYVTMEHKKKLKEEYGIEPWTVVQRLGDAVFVPAGCPHQIRYLKSCINVRTDFISPESVAECNRLLEQYRSSPDHVLKEDHLQVEQMTCLAIDQAVKQFERISLSQDLSGKEQPSVAFMKQEMEKMKLFLEKEGHTLPNDKREMLWNEITGFLSKLNAMEASHASSSTRPPRQ